MLYFYMTIFSKYCIFIWQFFQSFSNSEFFFSMVYLWWKHNSTFFHSDYTYLQYSKVLFSVWIFFLQVKILHSFSFFCWQATLMLSSPICYFMHYGDWWSAYFPCTHCSKIRKKCIVFPQKTTTYFVTLLNG